MVTHVMGKRGKQFYKQASLLLSFLVLYATLSLFVDFFHNHDPDFRFYDNCPACQWEQQIQDDHSEFETILEHLFNVFACSSQNIILENTLFHDQTDQCFYFSRAPPIL